jgi:hypothetical protein
VIDGLKAALGRHHVDTLGATLNLAVLLRAAGARRAETMEAQKERDGETAPYPNVFWGR